MHLVLYLSKTNVGLTHVEAFKNLILVMKMCFHLLLIWSIAPFCITNFLATDHIQSRSKV